MKISYPFLHADRIKVPLLIFHGELDKRVPIVHSEKMIVALKENGITYESVVFEDEGHGLTYVRNRYRYYRHLLAFLARHVGRPASDAASAYSPRFHVLNIDLAR